MKILRNFSLRSENFRVILLGMKDKDFTQYALLNNRYYKITIPLTTVISLIILIIIELVYSPKIELHHWGIGQTQLYIEMVPVMILTFLSGYSAGSFLVLAFFSFATFRGGLAYHCFMLLAASLFMNLPIYKRWFLKIHTTLLTFILSVIVFGPGWNMLLRILQGAEIDGHVEIFHFLIACPFCAFVCIFCYCYHHFLPQKIQNLFFATAASSEITKEFRRRIKSQKRPKISTKINSMVIAITITLLISAYGIAIALFSENQANHGLDQELISWQTIVFATRMVVLMMIVAIPAVLVAIGSTNSMITNPLILMTLAIEDGMNNPDKKSDVEIKKLGIKSRDEIGILYEAMIHSYDVMTEYLENLEREKKLSTDLEIAKAASKAKSSFLSNMSHEIRTPINAILGLDEMIIRESEDKNITEYAVDIENAGKNLLAIVNDILDFSKIEAGKLEIIPVQYELSSTINDLVNMISKKASDKGLALNVDVNKEIPHILFGDDVRLKQCILNILTNAVKYTEKGSVTLKVDFEKISEEKIILSVHVMDTGIGIKEEDLPKLFTAFQRIEEKRNRGIEGTGLGVNIVQQLLGLMHSHLQVKSEYGKGSDFYFSVEQGVSNWEQIGDFTEMYKNSIGSMKKYTETFHAPNAKILIVDDTKLNLTVVCGLLKQTQIQIETAESGQETLELVTKNKYDAIFLDHRMPGMDGIETLQAMKSLSTNLNKDTPVIALTANAVSGARESYLEAGFIDYLSKPIESKKLEKMLIQYLPKEKVQIYHANADSDMQKKSADDLQNLNEKFKNAKMLKMENALKNLGEYDLVLKTVKEYYEAIEEKSLLIKKYYDEKDWKNFTVQVHALKSSSRLIGAEKLSLDSAYLEKCGDSKNEDEISAITPSLLKEYDELKNVLKDVFEAEQNDSQKQKMDVQTFEEAMQNILSCIQAFDFTTADTIIQMVEGYIVPKGKEEKFRSIKRAVANVDRDAVLKLFEPED